MVNAIFYTPGCQWRLLPSDFPHFTTVQRYFYAWRAERRWQRFNHALLMKVREAAGRDASPSAGIIDRQSVKTTEAGGPRGYAAEKKVNGHKRHILTDTIGCWPARSFTRPMCRTATERVGCCAASAARFPGCVISSPTAPARATS